MERRTPGSSVNGDCYGESSFQDTDVCDYDENMLPELLNSQVDSTLQGLDMGAIKKNSYERTRAAMAVSTNYTKIESCNLIYERLWLTCSWEFSLSLLVLFIYQFSSFSERKQLW